MRLSHALCALPLMHRLFHPLNLGKQDSTCMRAQYSEYRRKPLLLLLIDRGIALTHRTRSLRFVQ